MNWYWIVLIVIGYMVMHLVTAIIAYKCEMFDKEVAIFTAFFWPIVFPLIIIWIIFNKFVK